jgi:hypothetical protein
MSDPDISRNPHRSAPRTPNNQWWLTYINIETKILRDPMAQNQGMVPTFRTSSPPPWVLRPNGAPCPTWVATENTDDGTSVAWYPSKWDLWGVVKKTRGFQEHVFFFWWGTRGFQWISMDFSFEMTWFLYESYAPEISLCWMLTYAFVQMMLRDLMPVLLRFCQGLALRIEYLHIVGPCGTAIWTDPVQNRGL